MKYEIFLSSDVDGLPISVLSLIPNEKTIRGVVQLVHGMAEHKERYLPFMEYLNEQGYAAVIHDHRGHGQSVRSKDDLGYMYGGGSDAMIKDMLTVNRYIHREYPGLPIILLGHSMGSLAVRAFTAKHEDCIDMLIVSGSPADNAARPAGAMIAKIEGKIFGMRHKSSLLSSMSLGASEKMFLSDGSRNAWICSVRDVWEAYDACEYDGFMFTDDGFIGLFGLMRDCYRVSGFHVQNPALPIVFLAGKEDPCTGGKKGFADAVKKMKKVGYTNIRARRYPNMRHEILNEADHEKVWGDILKQIRAAGF